LPPVLCLLCLSITSPSLPYCVSPASSPLVCSFVCYSSGAPRALHSFPTRRSSDLISRTRGTCSASIRTPRATWTCWSNTACPTRSEEHTSELQSRFELVCRLLLEKKKRS